MSYSQIWCMGGIEEGDAFLLKWGCQKPGHSAHSRCATMHEDTTIPFRNPVLRDELSELVRAAARDTRGHRAVVRNGYLLSREVLTGIGLARAGASAWSCCRRI